MDKRSLSDKYVVGIDVHKYKHMATMVTRESALIAKVELDNTEEGIERFISEFSEKAEGKGLVYALEDVEGNGSLLASELYSKGYEVLQISSNLTGSRRRAEEHADKNDFLDAMRVAQEAILRYRSGKLPQLIITERKEKAKQARGLVSDRTDLIKRRTEYKNQLHELLAEKYSSNYRDEVDYKDIFCPKSIEQWLEKVGDNTLLDFRIKERFKGIKDLNRKIKKFDKKIEELSKDNIDIKLLESIPGCGKTIACMLLGSIGDINRFTSSDALAKYAGIAPRSHSSGNRVRHYTDLRGNRELHKAFYQVALAQLGNNGFEVSKEYRNRKLQEGKSKMHSIRCLMRQLVKVVYAILKEQKRFDKQRYLTKNSI
jgi:transposase